MPSSRNPIKATTPEAVWNPRERRFTVGGQRVTRDQLRGWVQQALVSASEHLKEFVREYVAGQLTFAEWLEASRAEITALHVALSAIARGGVAQMTDDAWQAANGLIDFELDHFDAMATGLEAGTVSEADVLARVDAYAGAGWKTFQNTIREIEVDAGDYDEEMRVLESDNPCATCLEWAADWVPIGSGPGIGDTLCMSNDQCEFLFRNSKTGETGPD